MNLKRYTEKSQEAVLAAQQLAERQHHPQIEPEHLLVTLIDQPDGVVPAVLRRLGRRAAAASRGSPGMARKAAAGPRGNRGRPVAAPARGGAARRSARPSG